MTEQQARRIVAAFNAIQYGFSQCPDLGEQAFADARSIIEDYDRRKWSTAFFAAMAQAKEAFIMRVSQESEDKNVSR